MLPAAVMTSCDDYLDTMPDNRATLDSEEKLKSILVSAYPDKQFALACELSSDNVDDTEYACYSTERWFDDTYAWKDEMESGKESLSDYWEASYNAIAAANQALEAVESMGGRDASRDLSAIAGEALMCRAYNHFILVNLFCAHYSQNNLATLGLPYMDKAETKLLPKYERGTLGEFYTKLEADINEGLQRVSDSYYSVPKYHFNCKAAWAFAARYYLYTEQWDKAVDAANRVLGSNPEVLMRDWATLRTLPRNNGSKAQENYYISNNGNWNFMLIPCHSQVGVVFGPFSAYSRYTHSSFISDNETFYANNVWGGTVYSNLPAVYIGSMDKVIIRKTPYLFEYSDPVANIGFAHSVQAIFTADETLLCRAEAYIMLRKYTEAAADLSVWSKNISTSTADLTPESITEFYKAETYCYDDENRMASALKKHLNPDFAIDEEGSVQECMLQCVLAFRRIETIQDGLRWFDIKRYGIEIPRRYFGNDGNPAYITDFLAKDDARRVFQIPQKVRDAGLQGNR